MRVIGHRSEPAIDPQAAAQPLQAAARFSADLSQLARVGLMPKGVYRYSTHAAADEHRRAWLARNMAELARQRASRR